MSSRGARFVVLPAAMLLVAACASAPPAPEPGGRPSGDDLLRAGDYDAAARAFERDLAGGSDSAVVREKLVNAKHRAAVAHATAAMRAADAGDVERARAELARADAFESGAPAVREAHATIDGRLAAVTRAAALRDRARPLMATQPEEAERLLAEAKAAAPDSADSAAGIAQLHREATLRAEADRSADRAAEAWTARDRERVARELAAAQFGGRPVVKAEALRRTIERDLVAETGKGDEAALRSALDFAGDAGLNPTVVRVLRDTLVDKLVVSAGDLFETRRPATAALLELEAKRLRGDVKTPALDQVREAATLVVLVTPFEDGTGGRVDGMRLARALRERLALDALGGGLPLRALDAADLSNAGADTLRLTGRVLTARETEGRVGRETRKVTYQTGTTRTPNPEFATLVTRIETAAAAVRAAEVEQKDAVAWHTSLVSLGFVRGDGTPRQGDVNIQVRIAAAQTRVDKAGAALKLARDAEFALRQEARVVPREIDEPQWTDGLVVVTTSSKTAQLTAHLDLTFHGRSLLSQDVAASAQHKETVSEGLAAAGIPADPDDTPDDATMAARAADNFAASAAGGVRTAAEGAARRHLVAARDAEKKGLRDEAAESYALYLLSTPDVSSPERADAARALGELLGVHVALRTAPRKEGP